MFVLSLESCATSKNVRGVKKKSNTDHKVGQCGMWEMICKQFNLICCWMQASLLLEYTEIEQKEIKLILH